MRKTLIPLMTAVLLSPAAFSTSAQPSPLLSTVAGFPASMQEIDNDAVVKLKRELESANNQLANSANENEDMRRHLSRVTADSNKFESRADQLSTELAESKALVKQQEIEQRNLQIEIHELRSKLEGALRTIEAKNKIVQEYVGIEDRFESELVSEFYHAKHAHSAQLANTAAAALGQSVTFFVPHPGMNPYLQNSRMRFTAVQRSNAVVVTDFPGQIQKAVDFLAALDQEQKEDEEESSTAAGEVMHVYRPVTLPSSEVGSIINGAGVKTSYLEESGAFLLYGSQVAIDKVLAALGQIDQPHPQILLRAWMVSPMDPSMTAAHSKNRSFVGLPEELSAGLMELLPGQSYLGTASLMLRTSAAPKGEIYVSTNPKSNSVDTWSLEAVVEQYHAASKTLTLKKCRTSVTQGSTVDELSLNLALAEGEYAVVGSFSGGDKLLVLSYSLQ